MGDILAPTTNPEITPLKTLAPLVYTGNGNEPLPTAANTMALIRHPLPQFTHGTSSVLTLRDAVLLALHHNPHLAIAFNTRFVDRYNLLTAEQTFIPQVTLASSLSYSRVDTQTSGDSTDTSNDSTTKQANIGPSVKWLLPLGTTLSGSLGYNPSKQSGSDQQNSNSFTWDVSVSQPLLQGFGWDVNMASLRNARDTQIIDDLTLKTQVETTIATTVTDFYTLVQSKLNLEIAKQTLEQYQRTLYTRKMKYQAGQISGSDVTQAKLDVATQQQALAAATAELASNRQNLLVELGLPNNTTFQVDTSLILSPLTVTLSKAVADALKNNITMETARLNYRIDQRNVVVGENKSDWSLDLDLDRSRQRENVAYADDASPNSNSIVNNTSVTLNLSIPLDRVSIDQKLYTIKNSMTNQQITLESTKQNLITQLQTAILNLNTQWQKLKIDEVQLKLAKQNTYAAEIKARYGKIDPFTLSQQQQALVADKDSLVGDKIAYIEQIMNYQKLTGTLLPAWHIKIKAGSHD